MVRNYLHHKGVEQLDVVLRSCFVRSEPADVDNVKVVQQHEEVHQDPWIAFRRIRQDDEEQSY